MNYVFVGGGVQQSFSVITPDALSTWINPFAWVQME